LLTRGWVLLIIVSLLAGAIFAWYQYRKPEPAYQPPVRLTSSPASVDVKQAVKPAEEGGITNRPAVVANGANNRQRTPVETFQQPAGAGSQSPSMTTDKVKPVKSNGQVTQSKNSGKKKPASNQPVANKQVLNKQAAKKPAAAKATTANPGKSRPHIPAPISYWELPDAIREIVPEMKFTVLVYARDPADRFVLIDGQRYRQGERVQPDLFVREIRRKGVVFKYRLYKFLVER